MKILNYALSFGDEPDITGSELDFVTEKLSPLTEETKTTFRNLVKESRYIAINCELLMEVAGSTLETSPVAGFTSFKQKSSFDIPISAPFKSQWVEMCYSNPKSMIPSITFNEVVVTHLGMLIHESTPGFYDVYSYEAHKVIHSGGLVHKFTVTRNIPAIIEFHHNPSVIQLYLSVWMKAINEGSIGTEETLDYFLLPKENGKKEGKKKPYGIRRIVRVVPKKLKNKVEPMTPGGKVDFSHRWEVRGHWRRVKGIGKDRDENYGVHGITWVKSFVKGPDSLPLITKTRWVPGIVTDLKYKF